MGHRERLADTLVVMSRNPTCTLALVAALAVCLAGLSVAPSFGAPSAAQTAADQARVNGAVAKLEATRKKSAVIDAGIRRVSGELDGVLAEQDRLRATLSTRVVAMYQSGDDAYCPACLLRVVGAPKSGIGNAAAYADHGHRQVLIAKVIANELERAI